MEKKKDPGAVAMAKKRAASMTPERRKEIAQKAIAARWAKARSATKGTTKKGAGKSAGAGKPGKTVAE